MMERTDDGAGMTAGVRRLVVTRRYTRAGEDQYERVAWDTRDSVIANPDGTVVAATRGAEIPKSWSQLATDIVVSKYFRRAGLHGDAAVGERSVRQVVFRIARTLREVGEAGGYFADVAEADAFEDELTFLLLNQYGAFNSPVWFNVGLAQRYAIRSQGGNWHYDEALGRAVETEDAYTNPQGSACFIQGVEDDLMSIFELVKNEARLFKYGSGTGTNFSALRGHQEKLSGGGTSSGMMSFMEVFDRAAGSTKSGGTTRRAAKMACLDMDHPEIVDFIEWKMKEEKKAQALIAAGYPSDFNGEAYRTVSGQNSNNSVRVTDEFMRCVEQDGEWKTIARTTGKVVETLRAKDLWHKVALSAWACADPGVQYDTTINDWHTCKVSGRINASNPCCFVGESMVDTSEGRIRFDTLEALSAAGLPLPMAYSFDRETGLPALRQIRRVWVAGSTRRLVEVVTDKGIRLRCTPEHRFLTYGGEYVEAQHLTAGQRLRKIGRVANEQRAGRVSIAHRTTDSSPNGCSIQARWVWEQANGPIPDGYDVHHVNEDPTDDRLSNLEARPAVEHRSEHSAGDGNPNAMRAGIDRLAEAWEAAAAMDNGRSSKVGTVTVSRWNRYVKDAGLKGKVPFAVTKGGVSTVAGMPWDRFDAAVREQQAASNDRVESVTVVELDEPVLVYDLEVEGTHNFGVTDAASDALHTIVVSNSEFMFLDDTSCNLASLNLTKFLVGDPGAERFDVEGYRHAARVFFLAQEILVGFSSYPTKQIAQNSHDFRPLGLGYANLGTLLMFLGVGYDSDRGRAIAAALTAVLTGHAYRVSAEIASVKGPFAAFEANRESMLAVMAKHEAAVGAIDPRACPADLLSAAAEDWREAVRLGELHGYRNAQATVLAPTGTIGLLMDCDTTGIEPDFALVKFKKLAGGGQMKIVNDSVGRALSLLGYTDRQVADILVYVSGTLSLRNAPHCTLPYLVERGFTPTDIERVERLLSSVFTIEDAFGAQALDADAAERLGVSGKWREPGFSLLTHWGLSRAQIHELEDHAMGRATVEGAPHLREEHLVVFDCASRCGRNGRRYLAPMAHVKMMAATQPFLSGAISKTVNLPNDATVEEVAELYYQGWKLGLKAVALYRDGCKASQPLNSGAASATSPAAKALEAVVALTEPSSATAFLADPAARMHFVNTTAREALGQPVRATDEYTVPVNAIRAASPTSGRAVRRRLPKRRYGFVQEVTIDGHKMLVRVSKYEDGQLGEIFFDMHKEGASFRALLNAFAVSVSIGLQYGIPPSEYVERFSFVRFEPQGLVQGDPSIRVATSIVDYMARLIGVEFCGRTDLAHVQSEPEVAPLLGAADAPPQAVQDAVQARLNVTRNGDACTLCGGMTYPAGACRVCHTCGKSSGCS
jgi:ribonucleotide reductase alpha subunit